MTFVQKRLLLYWIAVVALYAVVALFGYWYGAFISDDVSRAYAYIMLVVMALAVFRQTKFILDAIPNSVMVLIFAGMPLAAGRRIATDGLESASGMLGLLGLIFLVLLITFIFWSVYSEVRSKTTTS